MRVISVKAADYISKIRPEDQVKRFLLRLYLPTLRSRKIITLESASSGIMVILYLSVAEQRIQH